ncbi:MAG TPA: hypothetical protein VKK61_02415 [Tepidisphaeraceae bacterium]|nr:hypothetical protein [Tepidisphaeraceae bacterium]
MPAFRLLNDLGHDVSSAVSTDQALEMLQHDGADLVVVDADRPEQREFVSRLNNIPEDQQPQVAIFSDALDDSLSVMVNKLDRAANVHVLLKPLHMHGLLNMLRNIEAKA